MAESEPKSDRRRALGSSEEIKGEFVITKLGGVRVVIGRAVDIIAGHGEAPEQFVSHFKEYGPFSHPISRNESTQPTRPAPAPEHDLNYSDTDQRTYGFDIDGNRTRCIPDDVLYY